MTITELASLNKEVQALVDKAKSLYDNLETLEKSESFYFAFSKSPNLKHSNYIPKDALPNIIAMVHADLENELNKIKVRLKFLGVEAKV